MRTMRGFTLIELMIVVAVVAILAAIAFPSYQEHVRKSRRADARAVLMEAAQVMERNYTVANRYDRTSDGGAFTLPAGLVKSPKDGSKSYYAITLAADALSASTFRLDAAPTGPQADDVCGTLTLTQTGARGVTGTKEGYTVDRCWF